MLLYFTMPLSGEYCYLHEEPLPLELFDSKEFAWLLNDSLVGAFSEVVPSQENSFILCPDGGHFEDLSNDIKRKKVNDVALSRAYPDWANSYRDLRNIEINNNVSGLKGNNDNILVLSYPNDDGSRNALLGYLEESANEISSGAVLPPFNVLAVGDLGGVKYYTENSSLNSALVDNFLNGTPIPPYYWSHARIVKRALNKLPDANILRNGGIVIRIEERTGQGLADLVNWQVNTDKVWANFISTTKARGPEFVSEFFTYFSPHNVFLKIKGRGGKDIELISTAPDQQEVLFSAGTKFRKVRGYFSNTHPESNVDWLNNPNNATPGQPLYILEVIAL